MGQDDGIIFVKRNLCFISFISLIVKLLFDVEKKTFENIKGESRAAIMKPRNIE